MSLESGPRKSNPNSTEAVLSNSLNSSSLAGIPNADLTPTELRRKLKAVIVNIDALAEENARDSGERLLTESKEGMRGVSGFFKRVWKHTLFHEAYRQKYVSSARSEIREKGNLFATEEGVSEDAHVATAEALVDRFASEFEEARHEGEERRTLGETVGEHRMGSETFAIKGDLRTLMREYAAGKMSDDDFVEAKKQVLHSISRSENVKEDTMYADNLLDLAKHVKQAIAHGERLEDLDLDLDVVLGKARGSVATEAKYNAVDKAIEFAKKTPLGVLVNESTLASAISIAAGITTALSKRLASSKLAALGTFGATALLSGSLIGYAENKRTKEDRRQHAREMAQGRTFNVKESPRRKEMEKYQYEMQEAQELSASIRNSIYATGTDGGHEVKNLTPEQFVAALEKLADAEARIQLMDRQKIDLLSYSDTTRVESERFDFDMARAQAKVDLRKMEAAGKLPGGKTADELLSELTDARIQSITEGEDGIEERDTAFKKMKTKRVAWAATKGVLAGVVIGAGVQEATAFFNDGQTGLVEHLFEGKNADHGLVTHTTPLEGLRRYVAGLFPHRAGILHELSFGKGKITLPDDLSIKTEGANTFALVRDGSVITDHIHMNPDGTFDTNTSNMLAEQGITAATATVHVTEAVQKSVTAAEYMAHHHNLGTHVSRDHWYDNDTPKPVFDKNELKLWWGGHANTGLDEHGNIVFSAKHMLPGGSYHNGLSTNAQEVMKGGHLKLLLSLSQGTQAHPVEIPIDAEGTVHVDPKSEIGKLFFAQENGHARFLGRFAEVAQITGAKDGIDHVNVLATYEGKGVDYVSDMLRATHDMPKITLTEPNDFTIDPPPLIPIFERTPLEKLETAEKGPNPFLAFGYGYYGAPISRAEAAHYRREMSPRLQQNPDAVLDARVEGEAYFETQSPEYLEKIDALAEEAGAMSNDCKVAVCIPVAGHQEAQNIEKTLSAYLQQKADTKSFEIVLFVNQPDTAPNGEKITSDGTLHKIEEFKTAHPELLVRVMNMVLPRSEARIGYIRKLLSDTTLRRSLKRSGNEDLIMVSNDADLKGVAPEYVSNFVSKFAEEKNADAFMGQLDWDPESYIRNPLVHIGTRLFQYIGMQHRKAGRGIESSGANFAYRSSMYAAVKGYDANVGMGEDNDFGRKLMTARYGAPNRRPIVFGGARVSRVYTSSRRAEKAVRDGLAPIEQWERGFGAFDDEVRKVKWEDTGGVPDYDDPEVVERLTTELENILNRTIAVSSQWWSHAPYATYQRRALGWLGLKYQLIGPNKIKITDSSKLIAGLKKYSEEGMEIMARKTGTLPSRQEAAPAVK
jgi:hypothetical protein